ncbi:MAG: nicotinate phosphoribosyltransferase [Bryobacteraceae bacterium]|jgi:nicotinate phosphoribosyltransferase
MHGLLTDLYELTMAAGYFETGLAARIATFELSLRRLPEKRDFVVAAGLPQAIEYLQGLGFEGAEIEYLRAVPQLAGAPSSFFENLASFRFEGDVWAVPEGTPVFAGEPLMTVRGPLWQAQIAETYLLSMLSYQTLIATKAARMVEAAAGRGVVEFGTRRAHSPEAGVLAGRAAYVGGCLGTSNVLTGFRYGVPVYGTAAHSWVLAFRDELDAHRALQKLLGPGAVYLIDTYDTLEGARKAASLGRPLWGVRLDSGDLGALAREVRGILDAAGLGDAKIMASGDLNEDKIAALVAAGAPIDAYGVGTELATSSDAPALGAIYKLVEIEEEGATRYTAKLSEDKPTLPGAKQIYRRAHGDVVALAGERLDGEPLLDLVLAGGHLVRPLPDAAVARAHAAQSLPDLSKPHAVEYSQKLLELLDRVRRTVEARHA